jgi:hypothetical protein
MAIIAWEKNKVKEKREKHFEKNLKKIKKTLDKRNKICYYI